MWQSRCCALATQQGKTGVEPVIIARRFDCHHSHAAEHTVERPILGGALVRYFQFPILASPQVLNI